jgi:hypothetical protein
LTGVSSRGLLAADEAIFKPLERLLDGPIKSDHDEMRYCPKFSFDKILF